jgi:uncharacterized protein YozE (UPF0346 family)
MTKSFYSWLARFRGQDSAIGDLANDTYEDFTFPKKAMVYDVIRDYLENYEDRDRNMFKGKACDACLRTFDEAYERYRKEVSTHPQLR